jgi:hypothetical protein
MEALGPADPVQVGPYRLVGRLGEVAWAGSSWAGHREAVRSR